MGGQTVRDQCHRHDGELRQRHLPEPARGREQPDGRGDAQDRSREGQKAGAADPNRLQRASRRQRRTPRRCREPSSGRPQRRHPFGDDRLVDPRLGRVSHPRGRSPRLPERDPGQAQAVHPRPLGHRRASRAFRRPQPRRGGRYAAIRGHVRRDASVRRHVHRHQPEHLPQLQEQTPRPHRRQDRQIVRRGAGGGRAGPLLPTEVGLDDAGLGPDGLRQLRSQQRGLRSSAGAGRRDPRDSRVQVRSRSGRA